MNDQKYLLFCKLATIQWRLFTYRPANYPIRERIDEFNELLAEVLAANKK